MLGDALSFLRNSDDWLPTLLIGGLLSVLSVLVLPAFVLQGYYVRVLRAAARDEAAAPSFTNWGDLVVDGAKLLAVNVAYALAVLVPVGVVVVATTLSASASGAGRLVTGVISFLGLLFVITVALVVVYVAPAAAAGFAVEGRLGAAFDLSTVFGAAMTREYAVAWLLALVVAAVGGLVGSALALLLVGIFVLFYVQVATFYLFGRGFARGREERAAREAREASDAGDDREGQTM